jgi:hypothetical protein
MHASLFREADARDSRSLQMVTLSTSMNAHKHVKVNAESRLISEMP